MRLGQEQKTISIVAAFTLVVLIIILGVIRPAVMHIISIDRDTYDLRVYLKKRYERTLNLRSSLQKMDKIKEEIGLFPAHIFHATDDLKLITLLEDIAAKNKVSQKITASNFDNKTQQQLDVSLLVTGDYSNILKYLVDLENSDYFINERQLQMSMIFDPATRSETASLNLDLTLYVAN